MLPDPCLVLPEMSRIRTSATPSTYPPGTGGRCPGRPGRTSRHIAGYFVRLMPTSPTVPADRVTLADLEGDPHPVLAGLRAAGAGRLGPGPGRLAGHRLRPGRGGPARRADVHRRRSPVLHRQGGRAEHALAGRRAARAPPGPVQPPLPARRGARAARRVHPGRDRPPGVGHRAARRGRTAPGRGRAARGRGHGRGSRPRAGRPGTILAWYDGIVAAVQAEAPPRAAAVPAAGRPAWRRPGRRRSASWPPASAR